MWILSIHFCTIVKILVNVNRQKDYWMKTVYIVFNELNNLLQRMRTNCRNEMWSYRTYYCFIFILRKLFSRTKTAMFKRQSFFIRIVVVIFVAIFVTINVYYIKHRKSFVNFVFFLSKKFLKF